MSRYYRFQPRMRFVKPKTSTKKPATFDEYWNKLPVELKCEVIDKMNIETRCNLRATSKTEKSLVDSLKIHFSKVTLHLPDYKERSGKIKLNYKNGAKSVFKLKDYKKDFSRIFDIFHFGIIDFLEIEESMYSTHIRALCHKLENCAPMRIAKFRSNRAHRKLPVVILKNSGAVEQIYLNEKLRQGAPSVKMMEIPAMYNAKILHVVDVSNWYFIIEVVEKWLEFDAEIGTTFLCSSFDDKCFVELLWNFREFEVYFREKYEGELHGTKTLRLRTENPLKHVLCEQQSVRKEIFYIKCHVIAASAADDDVITRDTKWLRDVTPDHKTRSDRQEETMLRMMVEGSDLRRFDGDGGIVDEFVPEILHGALNIDTE